ncbi:hypothetical protein SERLA73DRAFT_173841 [Serpula lacrymans var. lacrymans S7.3]|uniref:Golgi SNAP receptor complex member 1 n=2 Tax=Serpula lacrymans var. lacrymans TaxID=341189 RepID=F8PHR5_SERL3|nr:uncharacterized protein SERLADRAFT_454745 [Serpula lacrymans var. lacrymans S7.9]EGO04544.1 hypothetical protein SERLA73DRAFT_173841 [Serpula lacrymans var. lacrymans S7.3]EGO30425.1 hypothetical protein SERLADRAFT_454745 [Serpula lacrymans var. lacrymans S7.9]
MTTFDSLHRQCRILESLFDVKLTSYSRLALAIGRNAYDLEAEGSGEQWKDLEVEVDDFLEKLRVTNEQLAAVTSDPNMPPSQSMSRAIQRHRDVYRDYSRELHRTKTNVKYALDQANLLSGVRHDIEAYKSSAADSLLAERGRLDSSHQMTDTILEQVFETRAEFSQQSVSLVGIKGRINNVLNSMPGVNNLLSVIKFRRRRDAIILGVVIAACLLILLRYIAHN